MGPISRYSRNYFCTAQPDAAGNLFLSEPVPFRYVERDDTIQHRAVAGDTWWSLAYQYYGSIPEAANLLWHVIMDFQPVGVVDPTIALTPGTIIYVPSLQTLQTEVFGEDRRKDYQA